jgi:hypothetical protein
MTFVIGIATIFCLFLAGMFFLVCRKLTADANLPAEEDWLQHLSPLRYRPMERLLDAGEYQRLEAHPALTPKMRKRIRSRRVRLFREYLDCLSLDYRRACKAVKMLMVQSAQDRPDLAALLVRQRFTFSLRLVMAETSLTLHGLGVGSVDTAKLVAALDSMRLELNSLLEARPAAVRA